MDVLSSVLSLLNPRHVHSPVLQAGGAWSVAFPGFAGVTFAALSRGACWLCFDGEDAIPLRAGDAYLLSDSRRYRLATDPQLPGVPVRSLFPDDTDRTAQLGSSDETQLIGGRFEFPGSNAAILLDSLPAIVHFGAGSAHAAEVQDSLRKIAVEMAAKEPGFALTVNHLAHLLLVRALRACQDADQPCTTGWLGALADPRIALALNLMHTRPAQKWTLPELALRACMSRSAFAQHFTQRVGIAPMRYLQRWRIELAAAALQRSDDSLALIASRSGYDSESAFSHTFKRLKGCAPQQFRRNSRVPAATTDAV